LWSLISNYLLVDPGIQGRLRYTDLTLFEREFLAEREACKRRSTRRLQRQAGFVVSVGRRFSRWVGVSSRRLALRKGLQDCPLRVSALKNGETPTKMPIRVKNIGIATALIRHDIWLCGIFLDNAAK
jgi:hypothetical protein